MKIVIKDWDFWRSIKYTEKFYVELNKILKNKPLDHKIAIFIKKNNTPLEFLSSFIPQDSKEYVIKRIDHLLMHKYQYFSEYAPQESIENIDIYIQKKKEIKKFNIIDIPLITIKKKWDSFKTKNWDIKKIDETTAWILKDNETIIERFIKDKNIVVRSNPKYKDIIYYLNENLTIDKIEKTYKLQTITSQKKEELKEINWGVINIIDNKIEVSENKKLKIFNIENIEGLLDWIKNKEIKILFIEQAEDSKKLWEICSKKIITNKNVLNKKQLISWAINNISLNCEVITTSFILPIETKELNNTFNFNKQETLTLDYEEGLRKYRQWIYDIIELDVFKIKTIPYLAFKAWRTTISKEEIPIIIDDNKLGKASRSAYYGGWSEIYKPEIKKGFIYDINSLYPYIMKEKEFPIGKEVIWSTDKNIKNYYGIIKAKIEVENKYKNLVPRRSKRSMYGGNGKWEDWYTSEELKEALKIDPEIKIDIIEGYKFKKKGKIFKNFVDIFYSIKQDKTINKNKRKIAKLILNSLSGFLGAYKKEFSEELTQEGIIWKTNKKNNNIKSLLNVTIAAWITSLSRIYMSPYRLDSQTVGIMIDSIITSKEFKDTSNEKIGSWRLEKEIYEGILLNWDKYAYKTKEGKEIVYWPTIKEKINELTYKDFKQMLKKGSQKHIEIEELRIDKITGKKIKKTYKYRLNKNLSNRKKIYNNYNTWIDTESSIIKKELWLSGLRRLFVKQL